MKKSIVISEELKSRLDTLKKGLTYEAFLSKVANYLSNSGANLEDGQEPITRYVTSQASRVIEVVRGIEKKQNMLLKSIAERLEKAPNYSASSESVFSAQELSQVDEVVKKNEYLEQQLAILRSELRLEQEKNILSQTVSASPKDSVDVELIRDLLAKLRSKCGTIPLDNSKYSIPKADLEAILSEIKQLLQ